MMIVMMRTLTMRLGAALLAMAWLAGGGSPARAQALTGDGGVSAFYDWPAAIPAAGWLLRQEVMPAALLPHSHAELPTSASAARPELCEVGNSTVRRGAA